MSQPENQQEIPSDQDLEFLQSLLEREDFKKKPELVNAVNMNHLQYLLKKGFIFTDQKLEVIPKDNNSWIIKKRCQYNYILTLENAREKIKITITDNNEICRKDETYQSSWKISEIKDKNAYLEKFDDVDSIIEILKLIIENPSRFSVLCQQNNIVLEFMLPVKNNPKLELILEKIDNDDDEKKKLYENQMNKYMSDKFNELEQEMFNFSLRLNEVLYKNGLKCHEIFPRDIADKCKQRWRDAHPGQELPNYGEIAFDQNILNQLEKTNGDSVTVSEKSHVNGN